MMSRNQSKMNKEKQIFENQISLILREDKTLEIYVGDSLAAGYGVCKRNSGRA